MLGAVNITATNGNYHFNNDIGPHIFNTRCRRGSHFNPTDKVPGVVEDFRTGRHGGGDHHAGRARRGQRRYLDRWQPDGGKSHHLGGRLGDPTAPTQTLNQAVPIGTQNQVAYPVPVSPAIPPGPKAPLPGAPGLAGNGGSGNRRSASIRQ